MLSPNEEKHEGGHGQFHLILIDAPGWRENGQESP